MKKQLLDTKNPPNTKNSPKIWSQQDWTRLGSDAGQKRGRDEAGDSDGDFTTVTHKRRQVKHGSSEAVITEEAGQAAPVEYYIGNTTPAATETIVAEVVLRWAQKIDPNTEFKVVRVEQLAKHIETPK